MKKKLLSSAFVILGVAWSAPSHSQSFQRTRGPCLDLPELGSLLETKVVSRIEEASGGKLRYFWNLTALPGSRRTIYSLGVTEVAGQFTGPANWGALSGTSYVAKIPSARFMTYELDSDAHDLKAPNSYEFSAVGDRLPSPTLMTIHPRRAICQPTDEEWPALVQKGWTHEKLARLHRSDLYTNREIVVGPVLDTTPAEGPAGLFARAMKRLGDLQDYVSFVPADGERPRVVPRPPEHAGEFAGLTVEAARQRAILRAGFRERDLALVEVLYRFYEGAASRAKR